MSGMEKLLAYINGLSPAERDDFAQRCNTSIAYLRKACCTKTPVSETLCLRLSVESGFELTPEQLRPGVDWDQLRRALQPKEQVTAQ
jgi:DNA-binding transcriptional regulator YdaS (Cro superfamily)